MAATGPRLVPEPGALAAAQARSRRMPFGVRSRWVTFGLMAALCALRPVAPAQSSDYLLQVLDTEDGLPNSSVTAIAQTPDGYLWVGTYDGLVRFDGVRFTGFKTAALGHARIQDLSVDENGTLWINTFRGGLASCRNGTFRTEWVGRGEFDMRTVLATSSSNEVVFVMQTGEVLRRTGAPNDPAPRWTSLPAPERARLNFQCADAEGNLWFLTRDSRIMRLVGDHFTPLPSGCGPAGEKITSVAASPDGKVWAATEREIAIWDGSQFQTMTATNGEPALSATFLFPTRDGGLWMLADGRLRKQIGRKWVQEVTPWRDLLGWASGRAMGMHEDRQGGIWFNHYGNGIFHIWPDGKVQRFTSREGLPGDRVWAWFEDREGNVWAGVDVGGLVKLRARQLQVIGQAEGLPARAAVSVCQAPDGAMWFGTAGGGLSRWHEGRLESFTLRKNVSDNFVFSVFPQQAKGLWLSATAGEDWYDFKDRQPERAPWEVHGVKSILTDREGRVWMGTKNGLSWWTPTARRTFRDRDGMPVSAVRALALDREGTVWCGNDDGTLYRCDPGRVTPCRPTDALAGQPIWCLLPDKEGALWAGTFQGGLLRYKAGKFGRITTEQGLPDDVVTQVLEDDAGQLWLGTHRGICRVAKSELNRCLAGEARNVNAIVFGRSDGLPTLECSGNYQPSCWKAKDGRLWFATVKGMVAVRPAELKVNPVLPPVLVEELKVDGERVPLDGGRIEVAPGHKEFELRFTALSFIAPERVRFRYRLEGLDGDWVEAGTWRVAQYRHLPARDYRFQVLACNGDGKWNQTGAGLAFTVLPRFYETWWFLGLTGAVVLGGVAGAVRISTTRKYRQALAQLEQQHAIERDRTRIAKDIHDDLGAGLTQITLLSELANREPQHAPEHLDHISASARQMTRSMDEIVWAVDPQHDTLAGLMDYVSAFAEDFLHTAGLRCRMDLPAEFPPLRVEAETRYNLFLAFKEALNNVVKHARAAEVHLGMSLQDQQLNLIIQDDGQGLGAAGQGAPERLASGHGLPNLEQRLRGIGGQCAISSAPGQGTRITFSVPLTAAASPIVATGQPASTASE